MLAEQFLEGNRRRYTASFLVAATPTDPTTVKFYRRLLGQGASVETYQYGVDSAVVKDSAGVFHLELDYPDDGRFVIGAEGTGACFAYSEINVVVGNAKAKT